jgi:hypothetical protein
MDDPILAVECPPHHWLVTLVPADDGLRDHYRCKRCGAEKDVARAGLDGRTGHRPPGRPRRTTG